MENLNYNQQRELVFENLKKLDLSNFIQNKNYVYDSRKNDKCLMYLKENELFINNFSNELKEFSLNSKNLDLLTTSIFTRNLFELIWKGFEQEVAHHQIKRDLNEILKNVDFYEIIQIINKEFPFPDELKSELKTLQIRIPTSVYTTEKHLLRNAVLKEFCDGRHGCILHKHTKNENNYTSYIFFDKRRRQNTYLILVIANWIDFDKYDEILKYANQFKDYYFENYVELTICALGFSDEVFENYAESKIDNFNDFNLQEIQLTAHLENAYECHANRLIENNEI